MKRQISIGNLKRQIKDPIALIKLGKNSKNKKQSQIKKYTKDKTLRNITIFIKRKLSN
jgi:hypothetical protein